MDGLLIDTAPPGLRNRALALGAAGVMVTQGMGFALWGIAAQYAPVVVVIPVAAAVGALAVATLRPPQLLLPACPRNLREQLSQADFSNNSDT